MERQCHRRSKQNTFRKGRKIKIKNENKKGETNKDENKEKDKADSNKDGFDKDIFKQEAGQLKGNVIRDQNKYHLEKEEKKEDKIGEINIGENKEKDKADSSKDATGNKIDNNVAFTNDSLQGINDKVKQKQNILEELLFKKITQKIQTDEILYQNDNSIDSEEEKTTKSKVLILAETEVMDVLIQMIW